MIVFRKADLSDIENLVKLRIEFINGISKCKSPEQEAELKKALTEYFIETIANGEFQAWLAIEDSRIAATSGLSFYRIPPSSKNMTGKTAYIMNMYTIPEYRGRGLATKLFEMTINTAKELGYNKIVLHATEMGRPIYEKFGFKINDGEMVINIE